MPSVHKDSFTSFLTISVILVLFSCLTILARTSIAVLDRSAKSEYPYLALCIASKH